MSSKQLARKREQKREKGKIAPNVKKFLEKKEVEERRKRIEKKLELEKLNEARSAADKNKINKHLKVTFVVPRLEKELLEVYCIMLPEGTYCFALYCTSIAEKCTDLENLLSCLFKPMSQMKLE